MSTKKQVSSFEGQLREGNDLMEKGLDVFRGVLEAIGELADDDHDKSEETSGAVSTRLEEQAEKLESARDVLENAIDDIVSASGDALYALQESH